MRLRARVAGMTLLVLAPIVGALAWYAAVSWRWALEFAMSMELHSYTAEHDVCREGLPTRIGAFDDLALYDADFNSLDGGPPLPEALRPDMNSPSTVLFRRIREGTGERWATQIAPRPATPHGCFYLTGRRETRLLILSTDRMTGWAIKLSFLVLVVVGVFALMLGPAVRRLRALEAAAPNMGAPDYQLPPKETGATDEIGGLARALFTSAQGLRVELEQRRRRERVLRDFVSNTTHDLAVPLAVLAVRLSELHKNARASATGEAIVELEYLNSLLRNLSTAARLDDPDSEPELANVRLNDVVERVVARHRPIAGARGVSLEVGVPETSVRALADPTLIEQAVSNLVHNAIRHHPEPTKGHVAVTLDADDGGTWAITVLDDGAGIPEARVKDFLGDDEARSRGRGLQIVRRVAALHGFALRLEPAPKNGLEASISGRVAS